MFLEHLRARAIIAETLQLTPASSSHRLCKPLAVKHHPSGPALPIAHTPTSAAEAVAAPQEVGNSQTCCRHWRQSRCGPTRISAVDGRHACVGPARTNDERSRRCPRAAAMQELASCRTRSSLLDDTSDRSAALRRASIASTSIRGRHPVLNRPPKCAGRFSCSRWLVFCRASSSARLPILWRHVDACCAVLIHHRSRNSDHFPAR